MKALSRYSLVIVAVSMTCFFYLRWRIKLLQNLNSEYQKSFLTFEELHLLTSSPQEDDIQFDISQCSMPRCFNLSRCLAQPDFKVFVYRTSNESALSLAYANILKVLRESAMYTDDPELACVFVLGVDTIDRDRRSESYVKHVDDLIKRLPPDLWNEGRNHIVFNLYHGTYPDYSDHDLGFDAGYAIIARASANEQVFRPDFDLSFPLFHKEHPLRTTIEPLWGLNLKDEYMVSFKGKRYVYGIGSETRDSLYHLHNARSAVMVTTCKHNSDWKKYEDERCAEDNVEYERWNYEETMSNSTFCLTPRGRRLGSFRFLESLRLGCIPVVLSDDWVLPFSEVIDWTQAAVIAHEDAVLTISDVLNAIPLSRVVHMKQQARALYQRYFSSVEKIVLTSMRIVKERINRQRGERKYNWNNIFEGIQLSDAAQKQFDCTVVIQATAKVSGRLNRLVQLLSKIKLIKKIMVLWPVSRGIAPFPENFATDTPVEVVLVHSSEQSSFFNAARSTHKDLVGDWVVILDERVTITRDDFLFASEIAQLEPDRLLGFYSASHKKNGKTWTIETKPTSEYSVILLHFIFFHRTYLSLFYDWIPRPALEIASRIPQCSAVLLNMMLSEVTGKSPILIANRVNEQWMHSKNYSTCLNKLTSAVWPSGPSLVTSQGRVDPLLFLDNVGSYRKKFAGMEV